MKHGKVIITKKNMKGADGYKTFSIRIRDEVVDALDRISAESNRSRNELINIFLEFGTQHYEIVSQEMTSKT